ncbi:MAG: tRNA epoxyqueuosine(34) reductase QueG [Acidobacteriota bacterium]|nr:tRNA epoxyqueuosine(34) reductase QueG [Acidobacteriota bacterium]
MTPNEVKRLAGLCGFELAGVAAATPLSDHRHYQAWVQGGKAGAMGYLTDHRGDLRADPRLLLPSARSVICVGKLYNGPEARSAEFADTDRAWISRYAWGDDYHDVLREGLEQLAGALGEHEYKICVDTAPLLERAYAREAGLGWTAKNTCLINQQQGSWFFLGELLTSLEIAPDTAPADRCGTCTACIDACPTQAIAPAGYELDARLCIAYLTIELRGPVPEEHRANVGNHVFGCDICQDVCPWNRDAPVTGDARFAPREVAPELEKLAGLTEAAFRELYRDSPISRSRYSGFLRNVAIAMGNTHDAKFLPALEKLSASEDGTISEAARWAVGQV